MQQHQQRICTTPRRKSTTSPAQSDVMPGWLLISPTASADGQQTVAVVIVLPAHTGEARASARLSQKAKRRQLTPPTPNWMKIDPEVLELGSGSDDDELRACLQNHLARKARKMETNNVEKTDLLHEGNCDAGDPGQDSEEDAFPPLEGCSGGG